MLVNLGVASEVSEAGVLTPIKQRPAAALTPGTTEPVISTGESGPVLTATSTAGGS